MPRATVTTEAQRVELKSCPGGFVEIKQLPYHEMLVRRDRAGQLFFDPSGGDSKVEIATLQAWARAYEFKHCIVDHNLEDENGMKLDFGNDATLSVLDPRIGQEIEEAIDLLHNVESDVKDFPSPASSLSEDTVSEPSLSSEPQEHSKLSTGSEL